jgi:hypothetical protein
MRKELDELIEKYEEGNMSLITLKSELLRLFVLSSNALHDKIVKQIPDEYKEQISKTIKKHYR